MTTIPLPIFEVRFSTCGMSCRVLARARNELSAKAVVAAYLESSGMENPQLALDGAIVTRALVLADNVANEVANENHRAAAATLTTVEYSESCGFAVRCNGEIIDWFATRLEAEKFANQHDQLAPTGATGDEKAQA